MSTQQTQRLRSEVFKMTVMNDLMNLNTLNSWQRILGTISDKDMENQVNEQLIR